MARRIIRLNGIGGKTTYLMTPSVLKYYFKTFVEHDELLDLHFRFSKDKAMCAGFSSAMKEAIEYIDPLEVKDAGIVRIGEKLAGNDEYFCENYDKKYLRLAKPLFPADVSAKMLTMQDGETDILCLFSKTAFVFIAPAKDLDINEGTGKAPKEIEG